MENQVRFTREYVIKECCAGRLKGRVAAQRLNLCEGRIDQLKRKYRAVGAAAFVHGNKGRTPATRIPDDIRKKIVEIKLAETFFKANFYHFKEILEDMNIKYSKSAIRNILLEAGHKSPMKRRTRKQIEVHSPRPRRPCFGEMLQADASPFDWLGTGEKCALHGYIDDATSIVTGLYLEKNECLLGYLEVTRQTILNYGIPAELYPDKAGVFFPNPKKQNDTSIEEQLNAIVHKDTQLGKIMNKLGVHMHPAQTPEAKGRIERLWKTLQSRLTVEFKMAGIKTIEAANLFLEKYITKHNGKFSVQPASNAHKFVPYFDKQKLDILLSVNIERKTNAAGVFSFHNHKFQVDAAACRNRKINIVMNEKIGFKAMSASGKLFDIKYADYFNNKHITTHMPDVTKIFINKYLKSPVKETTYS